MKPNRIFKFINRMVNCETRIQLPPKAAETLLVLGLIKAVIHEESWSLGKFTCTFHELTKKGIEFYNNYCLKKRLN